MKQTSQKAKTVKPTKTGLSQQSVVMKAKDVLGRRNPDGNWSVLQIDCDGYFFTISGLAAEVWSMIDGKRSFAEIKTQIAKKHEVPARFENDMIKFAGDLVKENLVTVLD